MDSVSALDAKVPDYVWTEVVAWDICTYQIGAPANTFTVELLSDMEFLLFEGPRSGPGITWENVIGYVRILHEIRDWGGTEVTVVASQCTMKQSRIDLANTRGYRRAHILGWLAAVEGKARSLAIENTKTPIPQGRGWGYMRRADSYFAQKAVRGPGQEPTPHALGPAATENYSTDSTGYSSITMAASHHDTDRKQKYHDWREGHKTNAKKQKDRRSGWVVLPFFRESTKKGASTYVDWRGEVEEYITKGYSGQKINDAMFTSLEGKAKRNYQACDEKGDLTPKKILEKMDMIYGMSVSFRDLNAKLCSLKQGEWESPKDYYEWMVNISVALKEYHGDRFQPGELTRMKKACFFAGL